MTRESERCSLRFTTDESWEYECCIVDGVLVKCREEVKTDQT